MKQKITHLPLKVYIIGNIFKGDKVLLRKKFPGSKPYIETWYSFGVEFIPDQDPYETFLKYIKNDINIDIKLRKKLPWSNEIKIDHDDIKKSFIYLQATFDYVNGEPFLPINHESIKFVNFSELSELDIVPPSKVIFKDLGLIK